MWGGLGGRARKDKKGQKRRRYLKCISEHSLTGVVLFILPILQVRKLKLRDNLSNLGPEAETNTQLNPIFLCPFQLAVTI